MTKGTRVRSTTSGEFGTVLKAKAPIWNGEETEVEYLVRWDLDDEGDEPGWRWDRELAAA